MPQCYNHILSFVPSSPPIIFTREAASELATLFKTPNPPMLPHSQYLISSFNLQRKLRPFYLNSLNDTPLHFNLSYTSAHILSILIKGWTLSFLCYSSDKSQYKIWVCYNYFNFHFPLKLKTHFKKCSEELLYTCKLCKYCRE